MQKKKEYLFELYPDNHELGMLERLSHEFNNFKPTFKGSLKHTYVLSSAASDVFGFDVVDGIPMLGVPTELFAHFFRVRWYLLNAIDGLPAIYLIFDMGVKPNNHPVALRIYKRKDQVEALKKHKRIAVVEMMKDGSVPPKNAKNYFELPIKFVDTLSWEKI